MAMSGMAVASLIGALASAGSAAYAANQGGGGGGGGGGAVGTANPAGAFLNLLFGVKPVMHEDGSIGMEVISDKQRERLLGAGGLFGQEQLDAIRGLLTPLPMTELERGLPTQMAQQALGNLGGFEQFFGANILPGLEELTQTGFRTDIDPIRQLAQRRFERETIPGLREQFAGQTGTFSTDFLNSIAQSGADIHTQLGALQTELDEAASSRRATGLPLAQQLLLSRAAAPLTIGSDITRLLAGGRAAEESNTPGARALSLFSQLAGMGQPSLQGPFAQGFLPSSGTSTLAALSQGIPAFAAAGGFNAMGNLWNSSNTTPTGVGPTPGPGGSGGINQPDVFWG